MDKELEKRQLYYMLENPDYRGYFIEKMMRLEQERCELPRMMREAIKEVFFQMDMRKMLREEKEAQHEKE